MTQTANFEIGLVTSGESKLAYHVFLANAADSLTQAETAALIKKYGSLEAAYSSVNHSHIGRMP
jgi:hypothetical protein